MNTNTMTPDLNEVYNKLAAIHQIMLLTLDDLHDCMQSPLHYAATMQKDKNVLFHQIYEIQNCMQMLEVIEPEECQPDAFF